MLDDDSTHPHARPVRFAEIVETFGYRNVVTPNFPPTVFIHGGPTDDVVVRNAVPEYFLAARGLAVDECERCREILEKLSALGDWAAGEIVARRRRDEERERNGYHLLTPRLTGPEMLVVRCLRQFPGTTVAAVSKETKLAAAEVSHVVDLLVQRRILERQNDGALCLSLSEHQRYEAALLELKAGIDTVARPEE